MGLQRILPISSPQGFPPLTHLPYADNILFFCKGLANNMSVMKVFHIYGVLSNYVVNWEKSQIFLGSWSL